MNKYLCLLLIFVVGCMPKKQPHELLEKKCKCCNDTTVDYKGVLMTASCDELYDAALCAYQSRSNTGFIELSSRVIDSCDLDSSNFKFLDSCRYIYSMRFNLPNLSVMTEVFQNELYTTVDVLLKRNSPDTAIQILNQIPINDRNHEKVLSRFLSSYELLNQRDSIQVIKKRLSQFESTN